MFDTLTLARPGGASTETEPSLRDRPASYGVIRRCLELQGAARPRGRVARTFGADPLHPDAATWYEGALGEIEVARILNGLGDEWTVLHSVPAGARGLDIDHLLIGPAGVISITVAQLDGKRVQVEGDRVLVNGYSVPIMRAAMDEREDAEARLGVALGAPVPVTALIVVVGAEKVTVRSHPAVQVVTPAELERLLDRAGRVQSVERVRVLSSIAERIGTWQDVVARPDDVDVLPDRFDSLRREVSVARTRRDLWTIAGMVTALVATWSAVIVMAPDSVAAFIDILSGTAI